MNFRLKLWHHHSIPWPRFPYRARYFRDLRTFSVDFCIGLAECPPYFYFRSSWPTDLESVTWCVPPDESFHQVWSWYDHRLPCYIALLLLIRYVTLWPWPLTFWPWLVVIDGGSRVQPSTKFEDSTAIRFWVMRSDISHRIPLAMCLQPLRMRRITSPMCRGKFFPHIWNSWPRFAYSLYNFYGATIKTNGFMRQNSLWPCVKD